MSDLLKLAQQHGAEVSKFQGVEMVVFDRCEWDSFAAALASQGAEPVRDWDSESGCEWLATPPAATQVPERPSNWHRHSVAVEKSALQLIRNALRTDAEAGRSVRAEMLEILDAATTDIPPAAPPASEMGMREALKEIADMTYDRWSNGYRAGEIARATLAAQKGQP